MKKWYLTHGNDGYAVHLSNAPAWTYVVEWLYTQLDRVTFCRLCGSKLGEWAWKLPLGRPRYWTDEDGEFDLDSDGNKMLENSLAGGLYNICNYVLGLSHKHDSLREHVKISDELGDKLWGPKDTWFDKVWFGLDDDDDEE